MRFPWSSVPSSVGIKHRTKTGGGAVPPHPGTTGPTNVERQRDSRGCSRGQRALRSTTVPPSHDSTAPLRRPIRPVRVEPYTGKRTTYPCRGHHRNPTEPVLVWPTTALVTQPGDVGHQRRSWWVFSLVGCGGQLGRWGENNLPLDMSPPNRRFEAPPTEGVPEP